MQNANPPALSLFVTSASSGLGREVVRQAVARGHRVTGLTEGSAGATLVRADGGLPAYSSPFRAGEIKSLIKMANADVVIHLMPQDANGFPLKSTDWDANRRVLTEGTTALLDAVSESESVKFIVYTSYGFLYSGGHAGHGDHGHSAHVEAADESATVRETALTSAAVQAEERILHHPVPSSVLRAGTLYGSGDQGTEGLHQALRHGRGVYTGDAHSVRSWVHVADLASAVILAAEQQIADSVFNVADDTPASVAAFAGYLATSMGMLPPSPIASFRLPLATSPAQREMVDLSIPLKTDKVKETLGWSPKYPSHRTGLDQTLLVWRAGDGVKA